MLRFPKEWIPQVQLDPERIDAAVAAYRWTGSGGSFQWVCRRDLELVGTYLLFWGTDAYWEIILRGGVRGYSLYVHELTELGWYAAHERNPFDAAEQVRHYGPAHTAALLAEHRLLQVLARTLGCDSSLRALVLGNPHGEAPERDWRDVYKHRRDEVSAADAVSNPNHDPEVADLYGRLGFEKVS